MRIHTRMRNVSELAQQISTECIGFRVRRASRVLSKLYDEELRPLGLQHSQLPILVAVASRGERGVPMTMLAAGLQLDQTTLSRSVRPLEKSGLLRVARSPKDKRARILFLTAEGERVIRLVFPAWQRVLKRVTKTLGDSAMADLHARLDQVIALS
jgi:DNA-binding MarR family transcriptional regulator